MVAGKAVAAVVVELLPPAVLVVFDDSLDPPQPASARAAPSPVIRTARREVRGEYSIGHPSRSRGIWAERRRSRVYRALAYAWTRRDTGFGSARNRLRLGLPN